MSVFVSQPLIIVKQQSVKHLKFSKNRKKVSDKRQTDRHGDLMTENDLKTEPFNYAVRHTLTLHLMAKSGLSLF